MKETVTTSLKTAVRGVASSHLCYRNNMMNVDEVLPQLTVYLGKVELAGSAPVTVNCNTESSVKAASLIAVYLNPGFCSFRKTLDFRLRSSLHFLKRQECRNQPEKAASPLHYGVLNSSTVIRIYDKRTILH